MTEADKLRLMEAASILRVESRNYYDIHKHNADANGLKARTDAHYAYEKYTELNKLAAEIDIIAGGNL